MRHPECIHSSLCGCLMLLQCLLQSLQLCNRCSQAGTQVLGCHGAGRVSANPARVTVAVGGSAVEQTAKTRIVDTANLASSATVLGLQVALDLVPTDFGSATIVLADNSERLQKVAVAHSFQERKRPVVEQRGQVRVRSSLCSLLCPELLRGEVNQFPQSP